MTSYSTTHVSARFLSRILAAGPLYGVNVCFGTEGSAQSTAGMAAVNGGKEGHLRQLDTRLTRRTAVTAARAFLLAVITFTPTAQAASAEAWQPAKHIEIIIPGSAGGGQDRTGRVIIDILREKGLVKTNMSLANRPGGGGNLAYTYLNQFNGDAHYLATASASLLTNNILGLSLINYTHFTPVSVLYGEYIGFAVKSDGPFKTGKDIIAKMKSAPESVTFAFGTAIGNANHIAIAMALRAAGIDLSKLKTVVYKASIEATTALMGGHVDVVATPSSTYSPVMGSGKIRVVAISAPQRIGGQFSSVPTWREQGVDTVMPSFRMFIGARGWTPQQVRFWDNALGVLSKSPEWKKELDANEWRDQYLNSADSRKFLEARYDEYRKTLSELGLAKR